MSYQKVLERLRAQAFAEYDKYRALCSPYHDPKRGEAWTKHELVCDIYHEVRKSKSKSHKAALKICQWYVKQYKNSRCELRKEVTEMCLQICERAR